MIYALNTNYPTVAKRVNANARIIPFNRYGKQLLSTINDRYIDIKARGAFPSNLLSNFSATSFTLDGVKIKSMEGFLQSLKINNPEKQREMCLLGGFEAKKMSKSIKQSENDMVLYWKGKSFLRGSEEYNNLKNLVISASTNKKDNLFEFDGKEISSVNAFLTAIKVESSEIQDLILKMSPENLKQVSKNIKPKYQIRNLYWNGKVIKRDSEEYQQLLDRAYNARYLADYKFRRALRASNGYNLVHTRGKKDISETILTQDEFIQRLNTLRDNKNCKYNFLDTILFPYYRLTEYIEILKNKFHKS